MRVLAKISATHGFQISKSFSEICRASICVIRPLIKGIPFTQRRIKMGQRNFQHFPKIEGAADAYIKSKSSSDARALERLGDPKD